MKSAYIYMAVMCIKEDSQCSVIASFALCNIVWLHKTRALMIIQNIHDLLIVLPNIRSRLFDVVWPSLHTFTSRQRHFL